jgi:CDP-4-dehydro-6-deoxyglucose reductase/ferredoxin-NAD(P)+ reductase (naphthalene dioxygenase ferredoxin-specific)
LFWSNSCLRSKFKQWTAPLQARRGTILDIALGNGVPYPHSCRSGECGNCKTRLLTGDVDHEDYSNQALSNTEREQGLILACRARPKTDIEIAWQSAVDISACAPVRKLKATVIALDHPSHDVTRLRLQIAGEPLAFAAGQYARLSVAKLPARSYSMANDPADAVLEFHVRRMPDGLVSGYIASELKTGDKVRLEAPFGTAYLREDHCGPIIAAGGGTGLAPVLSIARRVLAHMPRRPLHIYFGVRGEADIYAARELEVLAAHDQVQVHIVLSDPGGPTSCRTGYVHQALEQDFSELSGAKVYLCGPPPMVSAMTASVLARGVAAGDIHSDPFTPPATGAGAAQLADEEDDSETGFIGRLSRLFKTSGAADADQPAPQEQEPHWLAATPALQLDTLRAMGKTSTRLLPPYLEHAPAAQALQPWLYLQGIATAGQRQLQTQWQREYVLWSRQDLSEKKYVYWWADGIYNRVAGLDQPLASLLLAGVDEQGKIEFIALEQGGRESPQDWLALLGRLRRRGLQSAPQLVIADSGSGLWPALQEVYPRTLQQYCWRYETARQLLDLAPAEHAAIQAGLRKVCSAPDRRQAEKRFYQFLYHYWLQRPRAAENMEKMLHPLLRFYHFPAHHQRYLRSAGLVSASFAGVSLPALTDAHEVTAELLPAVLYQLGRLAGQRWPQLMMAAGAGRQRSPPDKWHAEENTRAAA